MFGLRPDDAADGAGSGVAAGAAFCACASAPDVSVAAATSVDVPSRILRRLSARSSASLAETSCGFLVFASLDILLSVLHKKAEITDRAHSSSRTETRDGWWRYRSLRRGARPGDNAGNNSARTDASHP